MQTKLKLKPLSEGLYAVGRKKIRPTVQILRHTQRGHYRRFTAKFININKIFVYSNSYHHAKFANEMFYIVVHRSIQQKAGS